MTDLDRLFDEILLADKFRPYCRVTPHSVTVYFKPDADEVVGYRVELGTL